MDKKTKLQLLLMLSGLGWLNSLYTLWHRQSLLIEGVTKPSFCNLGGSFNCDAVALSSYSQVAGMPVAAAALIYYTVFFVIALWALTLMIDRKEEPVPKALGLLLGLAGVAMIPTLAYAYISFAVLKTFCLMCMITYAINLAILGVALLANWGETTKLGPHIAGGLSALPLNLVWVLLAIGALEAFLPKIIESSLSSGPGLDSQTIGYYVDRHLKAPVKDIRLDDHPTRGPATAALTIVEFSDFQCPHCAHEALTTPQLLKQYEGRVRVVFKNFPLDPSCNSAVPQGGHALACLAAKTGYCVYKKKGDEPFFAFKISAFEKQEQLSDKLLHELADKQGLASADLDACVNDYATQQAVIADVSEGTAIGVQGTPSLFLNGKMFEAATIPRIFQAVLTHYLGR